MKLSRDTVLAFVLVFSLILITIAAAAQQTSQLRAPTLSARSSDPLGARALRLWLDEIGYSVRVGATNGFAISSGSEMVLLLEPQFLVTEEEWETFDTWVEQGGTLVIAGAGFVTRQLYSHYGYELFSGEDQIPTVEDTMGSSPPFEWNPNLTVNRYFFAGRPTNHQTLVRIEEGPVMLSMPQGEGQVILLATAEPFTNLGLKNEANARFVLNLFSMVGRDGTIWFDEWHHEQNAAGVVGGPMDWLRFTSAGRALLYVVVVIFLALVLSGRRFGRPISPQTAEARRTPLQYVSAIANLNRRAGHRQAVLASYQERLKRKVGERYQVNPGLSNQEFVQQLQSYDVPLDFDQLDTLLSELSQREYNEAEFIRLAHEAAALADSL